MKTQHMADSCPGCLDVPLRMPLAYPPVFVLLIKFGHPSVGGRLNYGSSESQRKQVVVPRSE
jgi:hypothetical protein